MSYEIFKQLALKNAEFDKVPTNVQLLSIGAVLDTKGNINYKEQTYLTNIVKLKQMPDKLQNLFFDKSPQTYKPKKQKTNRLDELNDVLFSQLDKITDEKDDDKLEIELKKATVVCNIADKIIHVADLSLKAQKLQSNVIDLDKPATLEDKR